MPLKQRIIRLTMTFQSGQTAVYESIGGSNLDAKISISKVASALQQQCIMDLAGLTQTVQTRLLTQFSAYQQQLVADGAKPQYVDVTVEAGYATPDGSTWTQPFFVGQVVASELVEEPPNSRIRLTCYTRQLDKTQWTKQLPATATYRQLCQIVADAIGVTLAGSTSFDGKEVSNFGVSVGTLSGLVTELQAITLGKTFAFVDNGQLFVSDINKAIDASTISTLDSFIGIPVRDPYGAHWRTLLSQNLPTLAGAVTLKSALRQNSNLVNGTYVCSMLQYELCSRADPFYCTAWGVTPA